MIDVGGGAKKNGLPVRSTKSGTTLAVLGISAFGAVAATSTAVSAMPLPSVAVPLSSAEQVRYVCNEWGRCWWRPDYRGYGYYRGDNDDWRRRRHGYGYYGGYGYGDGHRGWRRRWHDDD
ncbi:hypothetical protein [Nitrobacter sp. JJSN]|uniref:hypothetical protein n=1 Tax=Nitrobacter sp. JJSN TaxID=3453033 RepID=UPI003F763C4B